MCGNGPQPLFLSRKSLLLTPHDYDFQEQADSIIFSALNHRRFRVVFALRAALDKNKYSMACLSCQGYNCPSEIDKSPMLSIY